MIWADRLRELSLLPRGRQRVPTFVAWAAGIMCLLAIAQRFRYATDLTDETFSIALPYRFALGDRPFVDEISIQQTAGIILFPFVWLFVKLTGGTTGIVLFVRAVHLFFFKGVAALSVHAAAKRWLKYPSTAIAVSFVPFAFVPHSIPNVGYNVIGMSMLTAGTFLAGAAIAEDRARERTRLLLLSGFALGVMSFAYPPMVTAPMLVVPLLLVCTPDRRIESVGSFLGGGLLAGLLIVPALGFGGIAGVRRSLNWGVHSGGSGFSTPHLKAMVEGLWHLIPDFYVYALLAIAIAWVLRSRLLVAIVIPAVTLACLCWFRSESTTSQGAIRTVTYAGAIAPALILLAKPDGLVWRGSALIVLPAFLAAVAAAYVSTQGIDAAALGFETCMVLFAVLAARALERVEAGGTLAMLPAFAIMLVLVTRAYDYVYRDAPLVHLTARVAGGPFKGIFTTPDRAQMFAELEDITRRYDRKNGRILFLYESPGLYLFSRMRPSAHCVWQEYYGDQDGLLAYWQRYPKGEGIVVRVKGTPTARIDSIVAPADRRIFETRHFIVYRDHE